jgi:hypothetical protein
MEAPDVHLQWSLAGGEGDALHDEFVRGDGGLAHIAGLAIAGTTPDPGNAVERQPTLGELLADETAEDFGIHSSR